MYAGTFPSDTTPGGAGGDLPAYVRAEGRLRMRLAARPRGTEAIELSESGGYRIRFPRAAAGCEAVMINTGGGMTGGDRLQVEIAVEPDAAAVATTQSAEKMYRSTGADTQIDVRLSLAGRARLAWLPQESILFSGARLSRRFEADVDPSASLTLCEAMVFGRIAMGETLGDGLIRDRWRVRRGGRLLFAEDIRVDGPLAGALARPTVAGDALAVATVLHVAPDAEARLEDARAALEGATSDCGASAWSSMLVARFAAPSPSALRRDVARFLETFLAMPLPRVWQC
ncbi:urease accessory protein UreD [Alsobacter sp. R-9]